MPIRSAVVLLVFLAAQGISTATLAQTPPAPGATSDSLVIAPRATAPIAKPAAHIDSVATAVNAVGLTQACSSGEKDAQEFHHGIGFGIAGALTGPIGVTFAALKNPGPPLARLSGMPADAATEYSRCYSRQAKRKNLTAALNGFAVGVFLYSTAFYYSVSKTAP
jgi:hypothetical protein